MTPEVALALATRVATWLATLAAGWLVTHGHIGADDAPGTASTIGGILLGIVTLGISWWRVHRTAAHIQTAKDLQPSASQSQTPNVPL